MVGLVWRTEEKPVGLVYIGLSIDGMTQTKECHFIGNREKIRTRAVYTALDCTADKEVKKALMEGVVYCKPTVSNIKTKNKKTPNIPPSFHSCFVIFVKTAKEMAEGVAKTAGTNIGLATTGIAGPEGGTEEKLLPVHLLLLQ